MREPPASGRLEILEQGLIVVLAAILLFWNLTAKDLWQDEAATAVLAVRMLKFGRPLAYDGKNLLTIDMQDEDNAADLSRRTGDPKAAIAYFADRGDFKPDTTWKWQPWGLFLIAGAGIKLLGQTTLGARLPFVLAALATVPLLFRLVRRQFGSFPMAVIASILLLSNTYWILHARQCRYYSVSSLFLVLTLLGYARWQWGGRSAAAFLAAAWCWFQVDYGTVLPVLAVLFLEALLADWRGWWRPVKAGLVLAATLAPFVYFYDLLHRGSDADGSWMERFQLNLFNMNEYVVPVLVVVAAVLLVVRQRESLTVAERRLVVAGSGIFLALALWIPTVTVFSFVRYSIIAVPVGAMLTAWVVVRVFEQQQRWIWPATVLLIVAPWLSVPLHLLARPPEWGSGNNLYRHELKDLHAQVFLNLPDPNRLVIDWLRKNAAPDDEIVINYEDYPPMYYLPNPIRGGVATFRVMDDAKTPPRFVVLRRAADFVHWPVFEAEIARYQWEPVPLKAPDVQWGNNPDPMGNDDPREAKDLYIVRRVGQ